MLALLSALIAALGIPFLWKAVSLQWGAKLALAAGWIFALYPESVLLGSEAMREPYLMTFSACVLWGFVRFGVKELAPSQADSELSDSRKDSRKEAAIWLGLGTLGMLLVSPAIALVTLVILAGWLYFTSERGRIPWSAVAVGAAVFAVGLMILSVALNRRGGLDAVTPFGVLSNFLRLAVKWDVHQLERGSGWIQKLFDQMPAWLWLPFVVVYGVFQPVLPAALVEPTTPTWGAIAILRAVGWYALLPALILSFAAGFGSGSARDRKVWLWLSVLTWTWILLAALRGGGDQWDNPRYRAILFLWQAILAGQAFVWWRASRNVWAPRVLLAEIAFLAVFSQWYASRYFKWGAQLPFGGMIALIVGLWALIAVGGWLWDRRTRHA